LQAFLVVVCAFVLISALPADESILSDNVDNFNPADDSEIKKKLLLKKLLILKKKKLIG
jgi:hypothetical protein